MSRPLTGGTLRDEACVGDRSECVTAGGSKASGRPASPSPAGLQRPYIFSVIRPATGADFTLVLPRQSVASHDQAHHSCSVRILMTLDRPIHPANVRIM